MSSAVPETSRVAITVPDVGAGEQTVRFLQWLVDVGSPVHRGDRVAEVLVTGIVFHVPAPVDGVLAEIETSARTSLSTGDVLGWIEPER